MYKRTQIGASGSDEGGHREQTKPIPDGRDILPFRYPIIPPCQSDIYRAKQTQFPRRDKAPWARDGSEMRKTNPIPRLRIGHTLATGRLGPAQADCTNKPNGPERIVQNEPNLPPPRGDRRERSWKTKPISPGRTGTSAPVGVERAKRSQFQGWGVRAVAPNKANWGGV